MKSLAGPLLNDLGIATSIVIVGGGVLGVYRGGARLYSRTIGSRRDLARRLNQLAAGVTLRYVEERFGTPAFVRAFVPAPNPAVPAQRRPLVRELVQFLADPNAAAARSPIASGSTGGEASARLRPVREFLFREKHAWIQVLVDQNGAVVRFSITVTDPRFRFQIRELTRGQLAARLGHSRFSDVHTGWPAEGRSLRIAAHNHEYAEAYWAGYHQRREPAVLCERPAGTRQVAALAQPRIEGIQDRPADFAKLRRSERGQDRAPDVARVSLSGGRFQLSDGHVPVEDLRDLYVRARSLSGCGLFEQPAQDDQRLFLGLRGLAVPELPAGQRVDP